jgi:hypothetical protein
MKLSILIKEVAKNLNLPLPLVNSVIMGSFKAVSKQSEEETPLFSLQYVGTFRRKMNYVERYKNYLRVNEDYKNKQQ